MLASIIRAPGEMLRHARVYGFLVILSGVHGFLYLLNPDIFAALTNGSILDMLFSNDILLQARVAGLVFVSLVFSIYSAGYISKSIRKTESPQKNSLVVSSIALSLVLAAVVLALYVKMGVVNSLSSSGGIAGVIGIIFTAVVGLLILLCVIKFAFAPVYLGWGLLPKDALAQSWRATQGKLFSTIVVLFAILIVTGLIQMILGFLTDPIGDESLIAIIYFLGSSVGLFYSGAVLALAAPEMSSPSSTVRGHRKK